MVKLIMGILVVVLPTIDVRGGLEHVEVGPGGYSWGGRDTEALDFQFLSNRLRGRPDQQIEQLQREIRLQLFARDIFPALYQKITFSETNRPMSQCLADLSHLVGAPVPMDYTGNDFQCGNFKFTNVPLMDALKYLVAFNDEVLDVNRKSLVGKAVRVALEFDDLKYQLLQLVKHQQFAEAEKILEKPAPSVPNVRIKDTDGSTPLHLAVWHGQATLADRLVALGADINARDDAGLTPLHEAARFGNGDCCELLLKHGADPAVADNNGNTPLQTAIYYGYKAIAQALVAHGATIDLYTAAGLNLTNRVQKLLDSGADYQAEQSQFVDKVFEHGPIVSGISSPLHQMPGSYFAYYVSPLHWAARGGALETARLLLSRGEKASCRDSDGETPLFWAAATGQAEVAQLLIQHGTDVNATNLSGSNPLLIATRDTGNPDIVGVLLQAGARVNDRDSSGENALHKLAWYGCPPGGVETARLPFAAGGDIRAKNENGQTPLDIIEANELRDSHLLDAFQQYAASHPVGP